MADNPLLLVEGKSDSSVLRELLKKHRIAVADSENGQAKEIVVKPQDGIDNLLRSLEQIVKVAENNLGVVVDTDEEIGKIWRRLRDRLRKIGYANLPLAPLPAGTIIESEELPKLGIWIMPDNSLPGKIEEFVKKLVPEKSAELWSFAEETIEKLPLTLFKEKDKTKAQIYTYLAWQKKPGNSMGTAIAANYFEADKPEAELFIAWINTLFFAPTI